MFRRRASAGWQHDSAEDTPLKTLEHGLSGPGGPQRQFKVDHPKDGHTQLEEGFG